MLTTDRQYQRLMKEYNSNGVLEHAAMKGDARKGQAFLLAVDGSHCSSQAMRG